MAGAPAMPFTTFGVSPPRDAAVPGPSANRAIAAATSIYLRYEDDISGRDNSHAIATGLRMTWWLRAVRRSGASPITGCRQ